MVDNSQQQKPSAARIEKRNKPAIVHLDDQQLEQVIRGVTNHMTNINRTATPAESPDEFVDLTAEPTPLELASQIEALRRKIEQMEKDHKETKLALNTLIIERNEALEEEEAAETESEERVELAPIRKKGASARTPPEDSSNVWSGITRKAGHTLDRVLGPDMSKKNKGKGKNDWTE